MGAYNTLYNSVIHRYVPGDGLPAAGAAGAVSAHAGVGGVGVLPDATRETPSGCVFVRPGLIDRALNGPRGLITGLYDRNAVHILAGCITAGITPVTLLRGDRV